MRKVPFKKQRLSERILNELNLIFRQHIRDPRLQFVSLTRIELNDDNSVAQIYWDTFQTEKKSEVSDAIDQAKGKTRSQLAKVLEMRSVPLLKFKYDSQFEDEHHIEKILEDEKKKNPEI